MSAAATISRVYSLVEETPDWPQVARELAGVIEELYNRGDKKTRQLIEDVVDDTFLRSVLSLPEAKPTEIVWR